MSIFNSINSKLELIEGKKTLKNKSKSESLFDNYSKGIRSPKPEKFIANVREYLSNRTIGISNDEKMTIINSLENLDIDDNLKSEFSKKVFDYINEINSAVNPLHDKLLTLFSDFKTQTGSLEVEPEIEPDSDYIDYLDSDSFGESFHN